MNDKQDTYGSPAPYVNPTSGSAPSAGQGARLGGSVRVHKEAWMRMPLNCTELHRFDHDARTLLYDVHSGAFFEADDIVLDVVEEADGKTLLDLFEIFRDKHTEKDVYSAVAELREEGILSETEIAAAHPPDPPTRLEITRMDLIVTTDAYRPSTAGSQVAYMSETTGTQAVDTLIEASGLVRDIQLVFRGGEPLLNAPLVLKLIDYAHTRGKETGKQVSTVVMTDGACLNARLCGEFERRHTVVRLISDGTVQSLSGIHGDGPASLASTDLATRPLDVHLKIETADPAEDLSLVEQVLDRYPDARSVSIAESSLLSADDTSLDDLGAIARTRWIRGQNVRFREIEDRMDQVASGRVAAYYDGEGLRSVAVDPSGDIYVSAALIGHTSFKMGSVQAGIDYGRQRAWIESTHVRTIEKCRDCWARHLCAGGSRSRAYLTNGDVREPDAAFCRTQKRLYEIAIALYTDLSESHPEVAARRISSGQAA